MCHVSRVTCHMSILFFYFTKKIGQSDGASWWRVCYQRGLPRLVSDSLSHPLVKISLRRRHAQTV